MKVTFTVFTKPWKGPLEEMGKFVSGLGFGGIELPVRPGFQVEPQNVGKGLPAAARILGDFGLKIVSVAGPTDEATIAACAEAGTPIIRVMGKVGKEGYRAAEAALIKEYEALVPLLDRHGVTIGIQNHCDKCIANAAGLLRILEKFNPKHVAAVWDPAHCALNGELPELAADMLWGRLCMVNLKNAFWTRVTGPEAEVVKWKKHWTNGRQGLASWPDVANELKKRGYQGPVCLTAEYSDESSVNRLIAEDFAFAKSLLH